MLTDLKDFHRHSDHEILRHNVQSGAVPKDTQPKNNDNRNEYPKPKEAGN